MPLSGIGFGEMLVIAMLVLIVFGPHRLPEITRSLGKTMREFKRGMNEIQREMEVADRQNRWGSGESASRGVAAGATAAAAADTRRNDAGATPETAAATDSPDGEGADAATPDPVIAPPTFGSDLPEEIESQLAPPASETAAKPPPPQPETDASDEDPAAGAPGARPESATDTTDDATAETDEAETGERGVPR